MQKAGLPTTAYFLHRAIADRSLDEHELWDSQRKKAQDSVTTALASGIHSSPKVDPELPAAESRVVEDLAPVDLGTSANMNPVELEALAAANAT
jgi:hypothetical protein